VKLKKCTYDDALDSVAHHILAWRKRNMISLRLTTSDVEYCISINISYEVCVKQDLMLPWWWLWSYHIQGWDTM